MKVEANPSTMDSEVKMVYAEEVDAKLAHAKTNLMGFERKLMYYIEARLAYIEGDCLKHDTQAGYGSADVMSCKVADPKHTECNSCQRTRV